MYPGRRRAKTERNVIKSTRPQNPQRSGALGSSSKFSGLDRCCRTVSVAAVYDRNTAEVATVTRASRVPRGERRKNRRAEGSYGIVG